MGCIRWMESFHFPLPLETSTSATVFVSMLPLVSGSVPWQVAYIDIERIIAFWSQ